MVGPYGAAEWVGIRDQFSAELQCIMSVIDASALRLICDWGAARPGKCAESIWWVVIAQRRRGRTLGGYGRGSRCAAMDRMRMEGEPGMDWERQEAAGDGERRYRLLAGDMGGDILNEWDGRCLWFSRGSGRMQ